MAYKYRTHNTCCNQKGTVITLTGNVPSNVDQKHDYEVFLVALSLQQSSAEPKHPENASKTKITSSFLLQPSGNTLCHGQRDSSIRMVHNECRSTTGVHWSLWLFFNQHRAYMKTGSYKKSNKLSILWIHSIWVSAGSLTGNGKITTTSTKSIRFCLN